jgi:hypothetical protein
MLRTQIYLTELQHFSLKALSIKTGKNISEIIRNAIDSFVEKNTTTDRLSLLRQARGMWKDRDDLEFFDEIRKEADRRLFNE